jgi:GMP synthase-like glutamine amidotransferase
VPLLTGDDCEHQAFRVGPAAWAVQFHPEVLAAGADPDAALASVHTAEPQLRAVWTAMARSWGTVIRARARRASD